MAQKYRFRSEVRKDLFRVPITITRQMDTWLQSLSTQMKATGGYKLPKSYIIRALLEAVMELKINVDGIREERELKESILHAIRKYR